MAGETHLIETIHLTGEAHFTGTPIAGDGSLIAAVHVVEAIHVAGGSLYGNAPLAGILPLLG